MFRKVDIDQTLTKKVKVSIQITFKLLYWFFTERLLLSMLTHPCDWLLMSYFNSSVSHALPSHSVLQSTCIFHVSSSVLPPSPTHLPIPTVINNRPSQWISNTGVNRSNLHSLRRESHQLNPEMMIRMGLINIRSLANKTFILNDLFISQKLDFMLITDSWLKDGEIYVFSELLPPDCSFFSSPRTTGRGGGLASIYKNCFKCRQLPLDTYSCFELQLFVVDLLSPLLCALIYRPPKYIRSFLQEFSDWNFGLYLT